MTLASERSWESFLELVLLFERCGFKNYKTEFQSGTESVGHSVKGPFKKVHTFTRSPIRLQKAPYLRLSVGDIGYCIVSKQAIGEAKI